MKKPIIFFFIQFFIKTSFTMKNTTLFTLFLLSLIFSSCSNDSSNYLTPDAYVPGYAILLATSNYETGIIKIDAEENLLRGLLYEYNNNLDFNAYDDIVFKIKEVNGVHFAYDIKNKTEEVELLDLSDINIIATDIKMNLHNAVYNGYDAHLENRYHVRGHLYNEDGSEVTSASSSNQRQGSGQKQLSQSSEQDSTEEDTSAEGSTTKKREIIINNETYRIYSLCETETTDKKDCSDIYMRDVDKVKYSAIKKSVPVFFQFAPKEINGVSYNYVVDFLTKHVHFGDKVEYDK